MRRWSIPLIALVALAFTTTKAYEWRWRLESSPPPADPAQVTFAHTVAAVGLVEPSSENIAVSTPVPGLVMAVHVKVGDHVRSGVPLLRSTTAICARNWRSASAIWSRPCAACTVGARAATGGDPASEGQSARRGSRPSRRAK